MKLIRLFRCLKFAGLLWCILAPVPSLAAPEEIQVYLDEFAEPGKYGLDFHTNYVTSAEPGAATRGMFRVTPELSYGINEHWEAGFYWLASMGPEQSGGQPVTDGVKARLKWRPRAPSADSPWYWAVNVELGQLSRRFYPDGTSGQLKFIGVWKSGPWTLGANLNLDRALTRDAQQGATAEVDGKVAYRVAAGDGIELQLGLEHYAFLGTLQNLNAAAERSSTTYLVADFAFKGWDFNVGLGRSGGATQDNVILKAIIGVPF